MKRFAIFNRGLCRLSPILAELLEAEIIPVILITPKNINATLGWGRSVYSKRARTIAKKNNIPFIALEDGFLRSVELGNKEPPLSIVIDDTGIYYDATTPSQLEALIKTNYSTQQQQRAKVLQTLWQQGRVSKYNHTRELPSITEINQYKPYVLVVDQTLGDASIRYGLANAHSFQHMLKTALQENPDCKIILKVHPDVIAKRKRGHFNLAQLNNNPRIIIMGLNSHPVRLIEHAQAIYVVTSQMGFEGLLWNKKVRTFGMPFYAGWGLTEDELMPPSRRYSIPLENLIYAALIAYPRYFDPETKQRCEVERLITWMALQRKMRERFAMNMVALDFSRWKQKIVNDFLQGSHIKFLDTTKNYKQAKTDSLINTALVWGHKTLVPESLAITKTLRIEDGFIRSVGLGADLIRPLSWVIDGQGIYYDATAPSDLEVILQTTEFDKTLLTRAEQLRERLVNFGITKYNLTASDSLKQLINTLKKINKTIILVAGQVESDASLRYGAPVIKTNLALLQAVRQKHAHAYILYKPHPDVVAGLRKSGIDEQQTIHYCDQMIINIAMGELLPLIDEVHTMTSLTGFEALLRGKKVVCYGQPFYSGWGLTEDILPKITRRSRQLSLNELVAGTLILYPTYVSQTTHKFSTPECVLNELLVWRDNEQVALPWWRKILRQFLKIETFFKQLFAL